MFDLTRPILLLLALLLLPLTAGAQRLPAQPAAPTVTATINPRLVAVGQECYYTLTVRGARGIGSFPETITVPGLDIAYRGNNQATTIKNGRMTVEVRFNYSVIPESEGTFTIPAQTVTVDDRQLTSAAVRLVAKVGAESRSQFDPFVKLTAAKESIYVGEITPFSIALHVHQRTNLLNLPLPEITHQNFVIKRPDRPDRTLVQIDNQPYVVYTYHTTIQALQPGSYEVGPAKVEATISIPDQRRGMSSGFFPQMASRKFIIPSNPLELEIKPLPLENVPPSFSGAVGNFQLSVTAQPTTLNVGDPIAVDMAVSGTGNFDAVSIPAISSDEGWRIYPPSTTHENRSLGLTPGVTRYSQVFIPEQMSDVLPPFEFSFFDPNRQSYVVLQSDAVPLTMSPDPGARLPVESTTFSTAVTADTPVPEEEMTDILHILTPAPTTWATASTPLLSNPVFWASQAVPASAFLALLVVGIRRGSAGRQGDTDLEEKPRTPAEVLHDLHESSNSPTRFYQLVCEIFEKSSTRPDHGSPAELRDLYAEAQRITYAGVPAPTDLPKTRRDAAIALVTPLAR